MTTKLLVEGLDWGTTEATVRGAFAPFGRILAVKIATDWETGRSRGFGHVTYAHDHDARTAVATMDGARLDGKVLRVMLAPEALERTTYRSADYGYVNDGEPETAAPRADRRVYRSADFGYADGATRPSDYRSADYDGGAPRKRRNTPTAEITPAPAPEEPAAEAAADAETPDEPGPPKVKRGGAHRDAGGGWTNEGVGGNDKKTFG